MIERRKEKIEKNNNWLKIIKGFLKIISEF
jgi:hypothetical protein